MSRLAAIDVGSNALRLIIGFFEEERELTVVEDFREAVRLGEDVFTQGYINEETMSRAVAALSEFHSIIQHHHVLAFRAVATSAVRDAKNNVQLLERVSRECDLNLEMIDGIEEARLVQMAVRSKVDLDSGTTVLIDIGGGSVELSLLHNGALLDSESLKIGTVRLLALCGGRDAQRAKLESKIEAEMQPICKRFLTKIRETSIQLCVATGGNAEALRTLKKKLIVTEKKKSKKALDAEDLAILVNRLATLNYSARISQLGLKPDRADVIFPAALILQALLKLSGAPQVLVPRVGLKDGILIDLGLKNGLLSV